MSGSDSRFRGTPRSAVRWGASDPLPPADRHRLALRGLGLHFDPPGAFWPERFVWDDQRKELCCEHRRFRAMYRERREDDPKRNAGVWLMVGGDMPRLPRNPNAHQQDGFVISLQWGMSNYSSNYMVGYTYSDSSLGFSEEPEKVEMAVYYHGTLVFFYVGKLCTEASRAYTTTKQFITTYDWLDKVRIFMLNHDVNKLPINFAVPLFEHLPKTDMEWTK